MLLWCVLFCVVLPLRGLEFPGKLPLDPRAYLMKWDTDMGVSHFLNDFRASLQRRMPDGNGLRVSQAPTVDASTLAYRDFWEKYGNGNQAVIMNNIEVFTKGLPNIETLQSGKHCHKEKILWKGYFDQTNRLYDADYATLDHMLDNFATFAHASGEEQKIMHNADFTEACITEIMGAKHGLVIPKFFAQNFWFRLAPQRRQIVSPPKPRVIPIKVVSGGVSLLYKGATTGIWTGNSVAYSLNQWRLQTVGRQHCFLISPEHGPLLYPVHSDEHSYYSLRLTTPEYTHHPMAKNLEVLEVTTEPGDVMFLPAGWIYQCEALEHSMTLSFDYIDKSNYNQTIQRLLQGLGAPNMRVLMGLADDTFNTSMSDNPQDTPWESYIKQYQQFPQTVGNNGVIEIDDTSYDIILHKVEQAEKFFLFISHLDDNAVVLSRYWQTVAKDPRFKGKMYQSVTSLPTLHDRLRKLFLAEDMSSAIITVHSGEMKVRAGDDFLGLSVLKWGLFLDNRDPDDIWVPVTGVRRTLYFMWNDLPDPKFGVPGWAAFLLVCLALYRHMWQLVISLTVGIAAMVYATNSLETHQFTWTPVAEQFANFPWLACGPIIALLAVLAWLIDCVWSLVQTFMHSIMRVGKSAQVEKKHKRRP